MRAPSLVDPYAMRELWKALGQASVVVSTRRSLAAFLRMGGNAVIEASLFEWLAPDLLEPVECVDGRFGEEQRPVKNIAPPARKHAPSNKLGMDVLRRDNLRCRICDRSPDDNVDIELHVHHVRPAGQGGLTELANLLTLCSTCH